MTNAKQAAQIATLASSKKKTSHGFHLFMVLVLGFASLGFYGILGVCWAVIWALCAASSATSNSIIDAKILDTAEDGTPNQNARAMSGVLWFLGLLLLVVFICAV